ncbi:MAG: hypothetical protein WC455_31375 [Dehalococcoidia bacterium]|jgi:hypothetical protein
MEDQVRGVTAGKAFREAMLAACGEIKYDFDLIESTFKFMKSMEAVAKVELPTPGGAEIVFDHVVKDGKCMLQIAEILGILSPDKLPEKYKKRSPRMDQVFDGLWVTDEGVARRYFVGQLLTEEEAAKLVKRMRACGKRLHDINVAARAKADEERLERWKAKGRKVVRI